MVKYTSSETYCILDHHPKKNLTPLPLRLLIHTIQIEWRGKKGNFTEFAN
jgi:hypothetical protein